MWDFYTFPRLVPVLPFWHPPTLLSIYLVAKNKSDQTLYWKILEGCQTNPTSSGDSVTIWSVKNYLQNLSITLDSQSLPNMASPLSWVCKVTWNLNNYILTCYSLTDILIQLIPHSHIITPEMSNLHIEPFSSSLEPEAVICWVPPRLPDVPGLELTNLHGHLAAFVINPAHLYERQGPGLTHHPQESS